eukprot:1761775-Prymnesium_polylepis.1
MESLRRVVCENSPARQSWCATPTIFSVTASPAAAGVSSRTAMSAKPEEAEPSDDVDLETAFESLEKAEPISAEDELIV